MSELIRMDEKYQTQNGHAVRILCVDGPDDSCPVIGIINSNLGTSSWTLDGHHEMGYSELDLVPVPPPPKVVPLGPDDVIANKTLIRNAHWPESTHWGVISKNSAGVTAMPGGVRDGQEIIATFKKFENLQREPFFYSNDYGATWQKFEKVHDPTEI